MTFFYCEDKSADENGVFRWDTPPSSSLPLLSLSLNPNSLPGA